MARYPKAIESLVHELTRLPGLGRRGAERIVTHLLESPAEQPRRLSELVGRLRNEVRQCEICANWSEQPTCDICRDGGRTRDRLCVVERPPEIYAFEDCGAFNGLYHVLGGTLSPLSGVTPDDLRIDELIARVKAEGVREVIVALSPNVEGDATTHYLAQVLEPLGVEVAKIGVGLPLGANLGYADAGTLKLALDGRRKI